MAGGVDACARAPAHAVSTCGVVSWPTNKKAMRWRLARRSVICVKVQVARPFTVHSSRTLDSASPHANASLRESPWVDSTTTFE